MKVVLLAGGYGTRLSEYTEIIPKPMVKIGPYPIIWHIMNAYASFGFTDFGLALGYKGDVIKNYFQSYHSLNSDFSVNLRTGEIIRQSSYLPDWNVTLVDTGTDTMTGGRLKRLRHYIGDDERFMLTYGDGLSDVDLSALLAFHKGHGKLATLCAVRPTARFGELKITDDQVMNFDEKPQLGQGWINGGFFVFEQEIFDLIQGDNIMLEREPLSELAQRGELMSFKHEGFWQCMDNIRDHQILNNLWEQGQAPWKV